MSCIYTKCEIRIIRSGFHSNKDKLCNHIILVFSRKLTHFIAQKLFMRRPAHVIPHLKGLSEYFQHIPNSKVSLIYGNHGNRLTSKSDIFVKLLLVSSIVNRALDIPSPFTRNLIATHVLYLYYNTRNRDYLIWFPW